MVFLSANIKLNSIFGILYSVSTMDEFMKCIGNSLLKDLPLYIFQNSSDNKKRNYLQQLKVLCW